MASEMKQRKMNHIIREEKC